MISASPVLPLLPGFRLEHRAEGLQGRRVKDGGVRLLRQILMVPANARRGGLPEHVREGPGEVVAVLPATGEVEPLLQPRPCTELLAGSLDLLAAVPPQTRVDSDVGVEEVRLAQER